MRARDPEEREGGISRHSNRHSWDSDTATQLQNRGMADKIERSQSARFDKMADTSNRFERLNPDAEAPGEAKPGTTRNRKRNSRSVSGSSSYRSRSPKRKSGKDQKVSQASERGREKDNVVSGATTTTSCELEWDSGTNSLKQQEGELVSTAAEPTSTAGTVSGSDPVQLVEQTSIDKTSGASAQGGDSTSATASDSGEKGGKAPSASDTEKTKKLRLSYTRVSLRVLMCNCGCGLSVVKTDCQFYIGSSHLHCYFWKTICVVSLRAYCLGCDEIYMYVHRLQITIQY